MAARRNSIVSITSTSINSDCVAHSRRSTVAGMGNVKMGCQLVNTACLYRCTSSSCTTQSSLATARSWKSSRTSITIRSSAVNGGFWNSPRGVGDANAGSEMETSVHGAAATFHRRSSKDYSRRHDERSISYARTVAYRPPRLYRTRD